MKSRIVGFKKFTSKAGKKMCMLYLETEFATFDKSNAESFGGRKVETEWIDEDIAKKIDASSVNKMCSLVKEISGNRAYITDIIIDK